jgi:regulator of replication initiation timing
MSGTQPSEPGIAALQQQIADLIRQLQDIQQAIGATGEPASKLELANLQELGRRYSVLRQALEQQISGVGDK